MAEDSPKLFVSYSWTSPEHEEWVLNLASELRDSGIDVILDKWDLKEGNDAIAFMEKMVTDPEVGKVILICDRKYAEKADDRSGGVGTEAQIISPKIYGEVEQSKFVAVISETNADGKPFLPTYYESRIYIDLSDDDLYATNFEQLLRWVYDKPFNVKPKLGKKPAFLSDDDPISLGTSTNFRRAVDAIRNQKPNSIGALDEYLDTVIENLEEFRIEKDPEKEIDDQILENIEKFIPFRNELVELFVAIARFQDTEETRQTLHRFFERLIPYSDVPEGVRSYSDWDFDNFKFIIQELFIYAIAVLLKFERFEFVGHLLREQYYVEKYGGSVGSDMVSFSMFRVYLRSFDHRNKRLQLRRLSPHADLLEQRSKSSSLEFKQLMQADLILFIRDCFDITQSGEDQRWWPETLLYASRQYGPFEVFARAQSTKYFDNLKSIFNIKSKTDFETLMEKFNNQELRLPKWEFDGPNLQMLMNLEKLASRP